MKNNKKGFIPVALLIVAGIFVAGMAVEKAWGDTAVVGPGPATVPVVTPSNPGVYYHFGSLNLTVPWDHVNAVYLYDLNAKRNLVGGEAVVATLWKLEATAGAVTSIDGHGAPYVGGNLWFPNPTPQLAIFNTIQPGVFGGYDWNRGAAIWGFKAAVALF